MRAFSLAPKSDFKAVGKKLSALKRRLRELDEKLDRLLKPGSVDRPGADGIYPRVARRSRAYSSAVEHCLHTAGVAGSNPAAPKGLRSTPPLPSDAPSDERRGSQRRADGAGMGAPRTCADTASLAWKWRNPLSAGEGKEGRAIGPSSNDPYLFNTTIRALP